MTWLMWICVGMSAVFAALVFAYAGYRLGYKHSKEDTLEQYGTRTVSRRRAWAEKNKAT